MVSRSFLTLACVLVMAACSAPPGQSQAQASASHLATATLPPLATEHASATAAPATETLEPGSTARPSDGAPTFAPIAAPPRPSDDNLRVIRPGMAVRVTVDRLNVREAPNVQAKVVLTIDRGDLLVLRYELVDAGGYRWLQAEVLDGHELPALPEAPRERTGPSRGWVAVAKGTSAYVAPLAARCPSSVTLEVLSAMLPAEQLACFGGSTLEVQGTYGCGGCGGTSPYVASPPWLAGPWENTFLSVDPSERFGPFFLNLPPDLPEIPFRQDPVAGPVVRARGHFDDPRSAGCTIKVYDEADVGTDGSPAPIATYDPAIARLICRQRFVVEGYEVVGWDPRFQGG